MRWHRLIPTIGTDATAPVITSASSANNTEGATLAHALTANESVSWSIVGGADQAQFELSGSTLRWSSNGVRDFETPADANTDNAYVVIVRATDGSGNTTDQTITVTVLDDATGSWVTTFSQTLNADNTGWNGFNLRQHLATSLLSQSGTKIRMTLRAGGSANAAVAGIYAGHQAGAGDPYDFNGSQIQITVGGNPTFTVTSGSTVVTDEQVFTFDHTTAFIVACHFATAAQDVLRARASVTGATRYFKSAANETATSNVTGYSSTASALTFVELIEVFQPT